MAAFALVLGGGGTVGVSWSIGALAAASDALGFDFADAAITIGTSAGSVVAPQLVAGRSLEEMVATERGPVPETRDGEGWATSFDPQTVAEVFPRWLQTTEMDEETARWIGERALRASSRTGDDWVRVISTPVNVSWPDKDLRLIATDCISGSRAVFTRGSNVEVARAAAASSAVPSIIPPVEIDGTPYMDGGVWSMTNADLLIGSGVERAFILGPQAGGGFLAPAANTVLARETGMLERAGIAVHALIPGEEFAALGINQMDPALRATGVEIGLREGAIWAKELASVLQ
jgi:NTE family protein